MPFSEQEKQIMIYGKANGKSAEQISQAIAKARTGYVPPAKQPVETAQPSTFGSDLKSQVTEATGVPTLKRIAGDIKERVGNVKESFKRTESFPGAGDGQTALETGLQTAGQVAGVVGDVAGRAVEGIFKTTVTPSMRAKVLGNEKVQDGLEVLAGGMDKYEGWKIENPRLAADLEAVVNIASLVPIGGGAKVGAKGAELAVEGATKAAKIAGEVAETGMDMAKQGTKAVENVVKGPNVSGLVSKGQELLERVPRAAEHAKENLQTATMRAERIAQESSPAIKNAIKANVDEKIINTVKQADPETLKAYKEMVDISSNPNKTLGSKTRPEIVAGKAANEQYKIIDAQRKAIGQELGSAVDELSKTTKVKMSDGYKAIDDTLGNEGISIAYTKKGPVLDFKGSRFTPAERTRIQELYRLATEGGDELTPSQIYKKDNLFSKLQRESKFEGIGDIVVSTPDGDKSLFKVFREIYSKKLEDASPTSIRDLNKKYARLRQLQDEVEDSIVKTGSYDATDKTDLSRFAQTNLRRLGSDAQSAEAYREIAGKMDDVAREFGYKGPKPETLIDFASEMRRLFPDVIPENSFQGGIKTSIMGMAEKVLNAGSANLTDQQKALKAMLEELVSSGALK